MKNIFMKLVALMAATMMTIGVTAKTHDIGGKVKTHKAHLFLM